MQRVPSADPDDNKARAARHRCTCGARCAIALALVVGGTAILLWLVWPAGKPGAAPHVATAAPRVEDGFKCVGCGGDCITNCSACLCAMVPLECQGEAYNTNKTCWDRTYDRPLRAVASDAMLCGFGASVCGL